MYKIYIFKILILFYIISLVNGKQIIINCNSNNQPYIKEFNKNNEYILNNCIIYKSHYFIGSKVIFNKCTFHNSLYIKDSDVEIKDSTFSSDSQSIEIIDSDALFKNVRLYIYNIIYVESSSFDIYNSKFYRYKVFKIKKSYVDIYNSIFYGDFIKYYNEDAPYTLKPNYKKHLIFRNSIVKSKIYVNGKSKAKEISSEPSCPENNIQNTYKINVYEEDTNDNKYYEKEFYNGCKKCEKDHYSTNSLVCTKCIKGSSWDRRSSSCIECQFEDWCPSAFTCKESHKDIGCSLCSKNYFMLNKECKKCPSDLGYIYEIIIGLIATILLGICIHKLSTDWIDELVIFTVSISHFQVMGILTDFNISFPPVFKAFLDIITSFFINIFKNYLFNADCITNINYVGKYFIYLFLPLLTWIIIISSISLISYISNKDNNIYIRDKYKVTYVMINLLYLYQISFSWKVFNVEKHDYTTVMIDNNNISTKDTEWAVMFFIGGIFNLMFCISILVFYLPNITKYIKKNNSEIIIDFLKQKLKNEYLHWELLVEIFLKKGVISAFMLIPNVNVSHSFIFIVLICSAIGQYRCKPYIDKHKVENKMCLLYYVLEILYLSMETIYLNNGFNVITLSIILFIIYIISFITVGIQLFKIYKIKFNIWLVKRRQKREIKNTNNKTVILNDIV